ncbi:hypothetical protein EZI54_08630 [Marinobacter halodurans]|uniref:O-antigen ligase domain-containing protein n=1 Tax=Marinobacter halodurans TaxID=2528979 RepID=A0ABY1ZLY2_9GAMM|nr:hypothetical protein [Marinobacter halodurans]TBW56702.1 hypothetical protein EZI54_08630 [Marinobacter halodurans]
MATKAFVFFAAAFLFSNYYYLYFYGFEQGVSLAPGYLSFVKVAGVCFFVMSVFEFRLKTQLRLKELLILTFFVFSAAFFLIKRAYFEVGSDLYLNSILCFLPFAFLEVKNSSRRMLFFEATFWVVIFQTIIDFYINYRGLSLWDNGAYVGGLGNPSSFGMLCNIVLSYLLFFRKRSWSTIICLPIIMFAIVETKSLFSMVAMLLIFCYFFWCLSKIAWFSITIFGGVGVSTFGWWFLPSHLKYKIFSLYSLISEGDLSGSQSIFLRFELHRKFFENLSEHFLYTVFFGYPDYYYYGVDSQILTYFGSFGVLLTAFFLGGVFVHLAFSSRDGSARKFYWVSSFVLCFMFFSNRIIDYYPMPLMFLLLVFGSPRREQGDASYG